MKLMAVLSVIAVTMVATSTTRAAQLQLKHRPFKTMTRQQKINYLHRQIRHDHSIVRFFRNHHALVTAKTRTYVKWAKTSLRVAGANLRKLLVVPVAHAASGVIHNLLCIHRYEGAWNDPDSPYWGGLQMDMNFQRAYGREFLNRWGTADKWPVWAQLQAGARGVAARGYEPWPRTARLCGLY